MAVASVVLLNCWIINNRQEAERSQVFFFLIHFGMTAWKMANSNQLTRMYNFCFGQIHGRIELVKLWHAWEITCVFICIIIVVICDYLWENHARIESLMYILILYILYGCHVHHLDLWQRQNRRLLEIVALKSIFLFRPRKDSRINNPKVFSLFVVT